MKQNVDVDTVKGFGREWNAFSQSDLAESEKIKIFDEYFAPIDWERQSFKRALDMGCGSGRWSAMVAPRVDTLVAADASSQALDVARGNVRAGNVSFVEGTTDTLPFPNGYFDLIFCLGVLHCLPDAGAAIRDLAAKLSPGGTLLVYIHYAFDNRPAWFKLLWRITNSARLTISKLPFPLRKFICQIIAALVYWPLARIAKYLPVPESWPLKSYSAHSFYTMRTDALDRFGTKLEKRYTQAEVIDMLKASGLADIHFAPTRFWTCAARKPL